jgi:8-oxo-dGTP diphosphatase
VTNRRTYPATPILAVSAAIIRDGKVLIVRRARPPAAGLYTLPGGGVEVGETLVEAVVREVREETALAVEPVALAGYREAIARDGDGRVEMHFVILPFAARWIAGEPVLNDELTEALWLEPAAVADRRASGNHRECGGNHDKAVGWQMGKETLCGKGAVPGARATLQMLCFPPTSPMLGTPAACRRRAHRVG